MMMLVYLLGYYGFLFVLGGVEGFFWEIIGIYVSMAWMFSYIYDYNGQYSLADFCFVCYLFVIDL